MRLKSRWYTFFALLLLFSVPVWFAGYFYVHPQCLHLGRVNHGVLMSPPISEAVWQKQLQLPVGYWGIVYVEPKACNQSCQEALHQLHQVHVALGKNQSRVRRALLVVSVPNHLLSDRIEVTAPDTQIQSINKHILEILYPKLPMSPSIYVVDPAGRFILRYAPTDPQKFIYDDLSRLLKVGA